MPFRWHPSLPALAHLYTQPATPLVTRLLVVVLLAPVPLAAHPGPIPKPRHHRAYKAPGYVVALEQPCPVPIYRLSQHKHQACWLPPLTSNTSCRVPRSTLPVPCAPSTGKRSLSPKYIAKATLSTCLHR